ncbi:MAG: kelch repeat-containing protein, partial [Candidatus Thorarchaeota archaeon]
MKNEKRKIASISILLLFFCVLCTTPEIYVSGDILLDSWTWVAGSNLDDQFPTYGTKGVEDSNNVPGGRQGCGTWIDDEGNYWVFGGYGYDYQGFSGLLNDLWRYNITSQKWAWIAGSNAINQPSIFSAKGVFNENNQPVCRYECTSFKDNDGNFWLFGGSTIGGAYRGDLWCYNTTLNAWAWIAGSDTDNEPGDYGIYRIFDVSNVPPARTICCSWVDSDNLFYVFGGQATGSTYFNDLWCYNAALDHWAWISGNNATNENGVYGIKGIEDTSNHPGARNTFTSWMSSNDYLWLFGGWGRSWSGATGKLNDLWRYNKTTDKWAWMSGSNVTNDPGNWGIKGVPNDLNMPKARYLAASCVDSNGNFLLYGGNSPDTTMLNDLWRYDLSLGQWVWISGNSSTHVMGVYGTLGVANTSTYPGSRQRVTMNCDDNGYIWVFGGYGIGSTGDLGTLNDLWVYIPADLVIV